MKWFPLAALVVICAAGCVTRYPMGLTQSQWQALSPSQQAEYQAKQYAIDADQAKQAEARRIDAARAQAQQVQAEQERLERIYANARYGDIVRVNVTGGVLEYAGKHYPYEPVSFDLAKGEKKDVPFSGRGLQTIATHYKVRLSEDGNTIIFDDSYRDRIVLTNRDWEHGQTYTANPRTRNDVAVSLSGMTFFVKFKDLPGGPQRIVIERR